MYPVLVMASPLSRPPGIASHIYECSGMTASVHHRYRVMVLIDIHNDSCVFLQVEEAAPAGGAVPADEDELDDME